MTTKDDNKERIETIYKSMWSPRAGEFISQLDQSLNPSLSMQHDHGIISVRKR
ncbi:MAG: hypothetical protein NVSMB27_14670 [Ktedonobacteraceae bacterium]